MNRAKNILISLRLANSVLSTQIRNTTRPQVTQFSQLSSLLPTQCRFSQPITAHQKVFFSSAPKSVVELVAARDWSTELESELTSSDLKWTHEKVIYILKRLDKYPQKAFSFFIWVKERDGFRPSTSIYSLLLRISLLIDTEVFWDTLNSLKEQGFCLDEETYLTIIGLLKAEKRPNHASDLTDFYKTMVRESGIEAAAKEVVGIISNSEWTDQVEKELDGAIRDLSEDFVTRVLKGLKSTPSKASSFFDWIVRSRGYKHSAVTYNALARILGQGDTAEEFWSLIERMKSKGFELDIDTYVKISRFLQKIKAMEEAAKLYEFMMDGPYEPTTQDFGALLRRLSTSDTKFSSLARRIAEKYESAGHKLSKALYDGIHRCLTAAGKFEEADKVIDEMKNSGFEPDNITYSQLIHGLCKERRFKEAYEVLENMESIGCTPDIMTWTILIQGHCDSGEVDGALVCFSKMLGKGCEADADLLEVLIKALLSKGKIVDAYSFLVETGLKPWRATLKNLIEKLLKAKRLGEAIKLLGMMKSWDYPPHTEPFFRHIARFGSVEDAVDFLKALTVKNYEYPNLMAYLRVFKAFFAEGRNREAEELFSQCPHEIRKQSEIRKLFGLTEDQSENKLATQTKVMLSFCVPGR